MKKSKRWVALTSALALTGVLVVGGAVAANGDANDPLVSLSYLNKVVIPDVVQKVEEKLFPRQQELEQDFANQVNDYRQEMENAMGGGGSSSFAAVTMRKGQKLSMREGCEVMLRDGAATVQSPTATALSDMTDGATVRNGASLAANHLYMAMAGERTITAASDVTLLVRGGYTLN